MPKARSLERDKAFKIYIDNRGNIDLTKIANALKVSPGTIRGWKNKDKWQQKLNEIFPQNTERSNKNTERSNKNTERSNKNTERSNKSVPNVPKEKNNRRLTKEKSIEKEVMKNNELTDKQKDFCLYYVKYRNKTKAYMEAYKCSYKNACSHAFEAWKKVGVQKEIDKLLHEARSEFKLDLKDMLQKHVDIAFSDIGDYLSFKRVRKNKWTKDDKGQDIPVINPDTGEQDYFEYNIVELKDSKDLDTSILQEISEGKDGVKIKLQDKMKSLDFLSKHLGLLDMATKEKLDLAREKFEYEKTKLAEVEEENDGSLKEMLEGFRNEV